ncbi:Protein of unknown function (DUF1759) [Popillia japonica]|uniref:CCHC-type domain-containing protein n=1 Tax=Popillia japonica TaxID=7064 RepID=A0AAW1M630_POPJA
MRLFRFESLLERFDNIQNDIEILHDNSEVQVAEREQFENNFYRLLSSAKIKVNLFVETVDVSDNSAESTHASDVNVLNNIKLPQIILPKFNGNYDDWLEFRDTFESLIHKNDRINNIQKFHYLRASLSLGPAQIIRSSEFTGDNYQSAWGLIYKLDKRILRDWEELKPTEFPTIEELKTFLRGKANLYETLHANQTRSREEKRTAVITTTDFNCIICNKYDYQIYNCTEFLNASVNSRLELIKKRKVCVSCLRKGHFSKDCKLGTCKECAAKHNTLLHLEQQPKSEQPQGNELQALTTSNISVPHVLLSTVIINVSSEDTT